MQPTSGSQAPLVHALPSSQSSVLPTHSPATHASWVVQAVASSQLVPSATGGVSQPNSGLQTLRSQASV